MRRQWLLCAALAVLLGCTGLLGCSGHSSAAQDAANKRAFVHQLVGYCAQADRRLATIDEKSRPGQYGDQLGSFASKARSHPPPHAQRQQFDILLTAIDDTVQQYRSAQAALSSGNTDAYQAALTQADHTMVKASTAAQRYGMPPLADCAKVQGGPQQSPALAQPAGGWRLGGDSPLAVQQVGAAVLDGRIWVAGGLTGPDSATAKTEFYDPTIGTWSPGPDLPVALHHAMMVTYRNTVWVIGGFEPQGGEVSGVASARVLFLNQAENGWTDGPELHHARAAGAAAVVGNKIVVVGGRTAGTSAAPVTPTEVFDGTSWQDYADIPIPGDHLAAASDGTYLYAVGGRKLEVTANTAAVQRFDPNTDRWTPLPAMPSAVSDSGAAIVGGRLIVVGGESIGTVFNTVRAYDPTSSTWSTLANLAAARHGLAVAAVGNTLYAIDGAAAPGHNASTSTVQTLTVPPGPAQPAGGWRLGGDSPLAVQQVGAAVLDGRIWVAGGLTGPDSATAKTEFYDPTIGTWSPGPDLPVALHHAMMVTYRNTVWVIGGFEPQGGEVSGVASARVLFLNQAENGWTDGPELHHARAAGAAAVVGNKIVVVGGRTAGTSAAPVTPTEVFDGTSWQDYADIPIPGDHLAAASDGTYLYAVGGRKLEVTANTAAVQRFDPNTDRWTPLPAMPSAVSDSGAAIVGGRLIVVGGESIGTVFNTVRAYDPTSSTWSTLPNLAAARHGLAVAAVGNTLYAIDGAAAPGHNASTRTVQTLTFHS